MMGLLQGKAIIVTGASTGMGRASAVGVLAKVERSHELLRSTLPAPDMPLQVENLLEEVLRRHPQHVAHQDVARTDHRSAGSGNA